MYAPTLEQLPYRFFRVLGVVFLLIPLSVWAQESSSKPGSTDPNRDTDQAQADQNAQESSSQQAYVPRPNPVAPPMFELGRARSLQAQRSPLQVGPIYISTMSYLHILGTGLQLDSNNQVKQGINNLDLFRTLIVFDRLIGRSRVALQYQPQVTMLNGQVLKDLTNHVFSFESHYLLSPRWTMTLNDVYSYTSGHIVYGDIALDVDTLTGRAVGQSFLDSPHRYISNYAQAAFTYRLNVRDTISIRPDFTYDNTTLSSLPTSSYTYGAEFDWTRALSARKSFGLYYSGQRRTFTTAAFPNTFFQNFGSSYSYRFGRSWQMRASLGAGTAVDKNRQEWTITGNLGLMKTFRRSSLSLTYYRGNSFGPFVTNTFSDRLDFGYGVLLSRRWRVSTSAGYQHVNASGQALAGYYGTIQTSFQLLPRVSWVANFGRRWENGQNLSFFPQRGRTFFSTGLTWDASRRAAYQ